MINRRSFLGSLAALCGSGLAALRFGHTHSPLQDPPEDGDWDWWRNLNRTPLTNSNDPFASALIRAAASRRDLWIVYEGGSKPGENRKISPLGVFTVEGYTGTYAEAFCHNRAARRTFRIERIASIV
jgi:predicted DNA-binding transcriptional regulator YafY